MAKNELAVKAPAYLTKLGAIGSSDINLADEVSISYLKVVQKMSKEVDDGTAEYGDIINSVTKEKYEDEVNFVVVKSFINYKAFDKDTFEMLASGNDKNEFLKSAKTAGLEISEADLWKHKFYNFYIIKTDDQMRLCFSLGKTSSKTGKALVNMIAQKCHMHDNPSFAMVFTAFLQEEEKNKKKYLVWKVKCDNERPSEKTVQEALKFRQTMDSQKVVTADEDLAEEATIEIDDEDTKPVKSAKRRKF